MTDNGTELGAQTALDAIRFFFMAQESAKERLEFVEFVLDLAPETTDNGGFDWITTWVSEGTLKLELAIDP